MILSIDVGIKNLAICVLDETHIKLWKIFNLNYGTDVCTTIIRIFDELTSVIQNAVIVIERQMARKMCIIQCYLEMYFRIKGHSVILYSPKYKLAGSGNENSGRGLYQARKKASILLCKEWLDTHPQETTIHDLWQHTKKKDDIADTLLMAIAYQKNPTTDITVVKKIMARKPSPAQIKKGKYTKSGIKYLLQRVPLEQRTDNALDKKLQRSILTYWESLHECLQELQLS